MSGTTCLSTGLRIFNLPIHSGRGTLNAVTIITDGTNSQKLVIYDNNAAPSGDIIFSTEVPGSALSRTVIFSLAVRCNIGLFPNFINGVGASSYIVHYGA